MNKKSAQTALTHQELIHAIEHLETKIAFQEDTIQALDKLVQAQTKELSKLNAHVRLLAEKIAPLTEQQDDTPFDPFLERPPHY